jgi:hypothetical protein
MSTPHTPQRRRARHDGWTPERQLRFLQVLARTRCVTRAAAHVRMSRESAYRLRSRVGCELFALAWDSVFAPPLPAAARDMDKRHITLVPGGLHADARSRS